MLAIVALLGSVTCSSAAQNCRGAEQRLSRAIQLYSYAANRSGDLMDIATVFAPWEGPSQIDPRSIRPEELLAWKAALEEQVKAAAVAIKEIWTYEAAGCGKARQEELAAAVSQVTEGLGLAQSQLLVIMPIANSPGFAKEGSPDTIARAEARCRPGGRSRCVK